MQIGDYALIQPFVGINGLECYLSGAPSTPVSRVGNKFRLAFLLARALGLRRGVMPRWSWRNDLDECCALLNVMYADAGLRKAVAERVRSWVPCPSCCTDASLLSGQARAAFYQPDALTRHGKPGCEECGGTGTQDARRLWERLRREPVPDLWVERGAAWLWLQGRSFKNKDVQSSGARWIEHGFAPSESSKGVPVWGAIELPTLAHRLASHLYLQARSTLTACGGESGRCESVSLPGGLVTSWGAGDVVPEVMAQFLYVQAGTWGRFPVLPTPGGWRAMRGGVTTCTPHEVAQEGAGLRLEVARRLQDASSLGDGMVSSLSAAGVEPLTPLGPLAECKRWILYLDPPYLGKDGDGLATETTGYAHRFTRAGLLELVEKWQRAARDNGHELTVAISESCGLAGEFGKGWHEYHLDPLISRGSTFWADGEEGGEWLTMSEPARGRMTQAEQYGLFGTGDEGLRRVAR